VSRGGVTFDWWKDTRSEGLGCGTLAVGRRGPSGKDNIVALDQWRMRRMANLL
jgi:hypothetical protein